MSEHKIHPSKKSHKPIELSALGMNEKDMETFAAGSRLLFAPPPQAPQKPAKQPVAKKA